MDRAEFLKKAGAGTAGLALASNGLPYEVDSFTLTGQTPGTEAFDEAEDKGTPLVVTPIEPPKAVTDAMPLDQNVVRFD